MRKFISGILCLAVLLLLMPMAGAAAQGKYPAPLTDTPESKPISSWSSVTPEYWQESTLLNRVATRSGPGGNGVFTEELATFRLGNEISKDAIVWVGWKEPSTPTPVHKKVSGIYWALVEFRDVNGNLYRAYVGIDSPKQQVNTQVLAIDPNTVPYREFKKVPCEVYGGSTNLYYGPGTKYKQVTVRKANHTDTRKAITLPAGTNVDFLCSENDYALIEFRYPSWLDSPSEDSGPLMRAWVPMDAIRSK